MERPDDLDILTAREIIFMPKKRAAFMAVGFAISIVIISAILLYSDLGSVVQNILGANALFVLVTAYFVLVMLLLKALRWFLLLRAAGIGVTPRASFLSFFSGSLISIFTPGRVGEPLRVYFLKKASGQNMSITLSPLFFERALDFVVMLLFISFGLAFFAIYFTGQILTFSVLAAVFCTILVIVIALLLKRRVGVFFVNRAFGRVKVLQRINLSLFYDTMGRISRASMLAFFLMSVMVWVMESGILFFGLLSIGVHLPINTCMLVLAAAMLVGTLTFLPGNLGSFEASAVVLATLFITAPIAAVTGGVFVYTIVSYSLIITAGVFSLLMLKKGVRIS